MSEQFTLYFYKASPFSHKVELALVEANAPYKAHQIDLFNKPEWFPKVNPVGKVPAVTYGGPSVDPEDPSPLSTKLAESNVILEFLADLYPDSGLLPKDPVLRAKVRFFINATAKHIEDPWFPFIRGREPYENVLKGIEFIQGLLEEGSDFAVGDHYTIADACIAPHLARLKTVTEHDIGKFPVGMGYKLGEELKAPKFAKFMRYAQRALERPSLKQTYDEEFVITMFKKIFAERVQ
ncbi:thioredoxin-like protein [Suillus clintonianus]|uniref:thioredoxin-like protein n=1 Tax=Suillus clintonianus TaxID=1904413 RepID=UPI001B879ACC|nr:thioredoxin-like protein [Suillus clintonianus]KAG2133298.1 thioredoxin-like protein [Suillus clintonianus]